jgi:hypothetical protein
MVLGLRYRLRGGVWEGDGEERRAAGVQQSDMRESKDWQKECQKIKARKMGRENGVVTPDYDGQSHLTTMTDGTELAKQQTVS